MVHTAYWREEYGGQLTYIKVMLLGLLSLVRVIAPNLGELRRVRTIKTAEEHYTRPRRSYEVPAHTPGMRICMSREKYLRPTRYCNSRAPEVVALAHSLGAFRLSDRAYVETVFQFTKEKLQMEICPIDRVENTLRRGTGTCFHQISVFVALCRAAGVKARYKIFSENMIQAWRDEMIDSDPLVQKWYDAAGYFMFEGEGEALIDGRWQVAHVGPTAERQAGTGLPITRLGEDSIGLWLFARPGTVMQLESIPLGLAPASRLLWRLAPGSMERVSVGGEKQAERGRRIIAEAGGVDQYDRRVRRERGLDGPLVELRPREEIVFEK